MGKEVEIWRPNAMVQRKIDLALQIVDRPPAGS